MKWISVNERLPKEDEEVLVYGSYYGESIQTVGYYEGDGDWETHYQDRGHGYSSGIDNVTHWMILPKPPKQ